MDCTTANASLSAGSVNILEQRIEGQNLQYLAKGTSSAKSTTFSFWVKSSKTGTYTAEQYDFDNTRQISKTFSVTTNWTRVELTFPGDTTGAFDDDNAASLQLAIWLHAGSTYSSGTLNSSAFAANTNANRAVGISSIFDSTARTFFITGLQLEVGSVATDFEHRSYAQELALCQRYYYRHAFGTAEAGSSNVSNNNMAVSMVAMYTGTAGFGFIPYPVSMRALPTLEKATGTDYYRVYANGSSDQFNDISTQQFGINGSVINYYDGFSRTQGHAGWIQIYNTNAYIAFNAEL